MVLKFVTPILNYDDLFFFEFFFGLICRFFNEFATSVVDVLV